METSSAQEKPLPLSEVKNRLDALRSLVSSQGWGLLREVIRQQEETRSDKILFQPLESHDAVLGQEFTKGEAAAFRLVAQLPEAMISMYEQEVKHAGQDDED